MTRSPPSTPTFAPPRWGTPRTDRPTDGPAVASAVRSLLGVDLLPWQRHVMDVVHERDPATGDRVYDTVVLVVGRRAGKSIGALGQDWAFSARPQLWRPGAQSFRSAYTAQSIVSATRRLTETWDMFTDTATDRMRAQARHLRNVNSAAVELRWRGSGRDLNPHRSRINVFAPTRHSLRGDSWSVVKIDEVTALTPEEGESLNDAVRPALADQEGQLWWMSNLSLQDGGWLPVLMARGRAAAEQGRTHGIAYFEWSAPEGADITDPAVWRDAHPAVGDILSVARLRRELEEQGPTRFAAEYLNMPSAAGSILTAELWAAVTGDPGEPDGPVWLGADVSPDRTRAALSLAWSSRGRLRGGVLWTGSAAGLAATAAEQAQRYNAQIMYDPITAGGYADRGWTSVTAGQYAQACSRLVDAMRAGTLLVRPDPALDRAVHAAAVRRIGDGWAWTRRRSNGDITPLVSLTLAAYGARRANVPILI